MVFTKGFYRMVKIKAVNKYGCTLGRHISDKKKPMNRGSWAPYGKPYGVLSV